MKRIIEKIKSKYNSSRFAGLTAGQKCMAVWCALSLCGMCAEVDMSRPDWWLQILLVLNFGASSWCCAKWVPLGEEKEEMPAGNAVSEEEGDDVGDVHGTEEYHNIQM